MRKLGLFACGVVDNDVDEDEYWDEVRWRPREYVGDEDENDDEEDVERAGERRRIVRDGWKKRKSEFDSSLWLLHTFEGVILIDLVGAVEEREFELVPSEPIAESVVVAGLLFLIVTGDLDTDECELLGRRRDVILLIIIFFFRDD